jgi:hypothetical protein
MSETQQPEPYLAEKAIKPIATPLPPWTLRARHRRPAVVLFIALLIVLQLVLAGIMVFHVRRLVDLEERIELLEKRQVPDPE